MVNYLTLEDILLINRMSVKAHGGNFNPPDNLLHGEALAYLIEIVKSEMFGAPLYPTIADKAGLYMFNIISNHIFSDGNKRTGLEAAILFVRLNGYRLSQNLQKLVTEEKRYPEKGDTTNQILINFTLEVASGMVSLESCQKWFELNLVDGD